MTALNTKSSSRFVQAALRLDQEFREFERLASDLARINLESETGLERSLSLSAELNKVRARIAPASEELSLAMEEARQRLATAAELMAAREEDLNARQHLEQELLHRYRRLAEMVKEVTGILASLRRLPEGGSVAEPGLAIHDHLIEIKDKLGILIGEAKALTDEARLARMKTLERQADSLRQSLHNVQHRFSQLAAPPVSATNLPGANQPDRNLPAGNLLVPGSPAP